MAHKLAYLLLYLFDDMKPLWQQQKSSPMDMMELSET